MSTALIGGIAVIVVAAIAIVLLKKKKPEETTTQTTPSTQKPKTQPQTQQPKPEKKEPKKEEVKLPDVFTPLTKDTNSMMDEVEKNIETAMQEYQLQRDMIVEMLREFEDQLESNRNTINDLISQKNWEELEHVMHSLKGSSLNLKLDILGKPIQYIDDLLKEEKDLDNIQVYIDVVYKASRTIFSNLR